MWNKQFNRSTLYVKPLYLALDSKIRLFTASKVDCIFWPVIRCLSITTCTASSWLAEKQRYTWENFGNAH